MQQIAANLRDPSWWFSAFFIAIIASVIAGFAKDRISSWISAVSSKYRNARQAREAQRLAAIKALAENEGFLIVSMIRASTGTLIAVSSSILFFLAPLFIEFIQRMCEEDNSVAGICRIGGRLLAGILVGAFGAVTAFAAYRAASLTKTTFEGYRAYRKKRGLPPVN
jgi:MFS family permease